MENGDIGADDRLVTVFVFDDLIARLEHPLVERAALRARRWETALDAWVFELKVCNYMMLLIDRYDVPVEVLTWRPDGFARVLHDRLCSMDVSVRETKSSTFELASPHIATDTGVNLVYDGDPEHRWSYGFKCRGSISGAV